MHLKQSLWRKQISSASVRSWTRDSSIHVQREKIKQERCEAFRVWATHLLGDYYFLKAVLRHGIFDVRSHKDLTATTKRGFNFPMASSMFPATRTIEEGDGGDAHPAEKCVLTSSKLSHREALRKCAVKARQEYKRAGKIDQRIQEGGTASPKEWKLVRKYRAGDLLRERNKSNEAYGHGEEL